MSGARDKALRALLTDPATGERFDRETIVLGGYGLIAAGVMLYAMTVVMLGMGAGQ